ncbi:MAG: hypothetical protein HOJ22_04315 [Chloroflexi bacterium]|nr:hypothetical protein [Chloroflexota bacterium]MBT5627495.1 hypothetical protein [Chloroflexota bacterium]
MPTPSTTHSGGIKPLNAPRVVHVRTDSNGNPTSIQAPPAIDSPRARRTANRRRTNPRSSRAREQSKPQRTLLSDGKWMKVAEIENLWKVNDEWWRGPEEEIARLYYVLRLESGQQITVYLDLIANSWFRQAG